MKLSIKWLSGLTLAFLLAIAVIGMSASAQAADKWSSLPDVVSSADFCDDPTDFGWYQAQHYDNDGNFDFVGSTVACSGWAAIHQIAVIHGYQSVDAAGFEWVTGNRNMSWVSGLNNIGDFSP